MMIDVYWKLMFNSSNVIESYKLFLPSHIDNHRRINIFSLFRFIHRLFIHINMKKAQIMLSFLCHAYIEYLAYTPSATIIIFFIIHHHYL